jgi:hypothetical protein
MVSMLLKWERYYQPDEKYPSIWNWKDCYEAFEGKGLVKLDEEIDNYVKNIKSHPETYGKTKRFRVYKFIRYSITPDGE